MSVLFSKVAADFLTVLPREVRQVLGLRPGDFLSYRIVRGKVILARLEPLDRRYLEAVQCTLSEWASDGDAAAFDGL